MAKRSTRTRSRIQVATAAKQTPIKTEPVEVEATPFCSTAEPCKLSLIIAACDVFETTRKRGTDADALIKDIRAIAG